MSKWLDLIARFSLGIVWILIAAVIPSLVTDDILFTRMHVVMAAMHFIGYYVFLDALLIIIENNVAKNTKLSKILLQSIGLAPLWLCWATLLRAIGSEFGQGYDWYRISIYPILPMVTAMRFAAGWSVLKPSYQMLKSALPIR